MVSCWLKRRRVQLRAFEYRWLDPFAFHQQCELSIYSIDWIIKMMANTVTIF
jgi:hypothetical protein